MFQVWDILHGVIRDFVSKGSWGAVWLFCLINRSLCNSAQSKGARGQTEVCNIAFPPETLLGLSQVALDSSPGPKVSMSLSLIEEDMNPFLFSKVVSKNPYQCIVPKLFAFWQPYFKNPYRLPPPPPFFLQSWQIQAIIIWGIRVISYDTLRLVYQHSRVYIFYHLCSVIQQQI